MKMNYSTIVVIIALFLVSITFVTSQVSKGSLEILAYGSGEPSTDKNTSTNSSTNITAPTPYIYQAVHRNKRNITTQSNITIIKNYTLIQVSENLVQDKVKNSYAPSSPVITGNNQSDIPTVIEKKKGRNIYGLIIALALGVVVVTVISFLIGYINRSEEEAE